MQPAKTLIRIKHGSHLYGTSTPSSDLDFKGVHLPSGRDIILQRVPKVIDRRIKVSTSLKNTKDDVDDQSYALQKFIDMLTSGDTVATEILFAPHSAIEEQADEWSIIWENRHIFLNKQCKGFVGYCQRQAAKYGIKGSRMAACKDIVLLLQALDPAKKLAEYAREFEEFCSVHEFSVITEVPQASGAMLPHLDVVDRKVPYTVSVKAALEIFSKVFANYGERTRAAMDNEGIDWKAVSHAVRVARQAKELLEMQWITFPRPDAEELLAIKQGKLDYNQVAPMLEALVEEVDVASKASTLPGKSDAEAIDKLVEALYLSQVR